MSELDRRRALVDARHAASRTCKEPRKIETAFSLAALLDMPPALRWGYI